MKKTGITALFFLIIWQLTAQVTFTEVAQDQSIIHSFPVGFIGGGGVSFYDFNQDGLDDITLATDQGEFLQFYENTGNGFELIFPPLVGHNDLAKQVIWVDYDNDGDKDLWVNSFNAPCRLYRNNGDLLMQEVTFLAGFPYNDYKHFGAVWGDYNRDGWLDVYISLRTNEGANSNENLLFKNNTDGTFTEVTATSGAGDPGKKPFCAAFFDYNNDKWPDLYTANDKASGNILLKNNGDETFSRDSLAGADLVMDAMTVTVGDYDQDGWQDIYLSDLPNGNELLNNQGITSGQAYFVEMAEDAGVALNKLSWGSNFLDGDNDGDLDLYVSGSVAGADVASSAYFENDGTGHFTQPNAGFLGDTVSSFNNAIGDFNNDGFPDIMVLNVEPFSAQLWQNSGNDQNWLKVKLQGVLSNRDAIGAKMEFFAQGNYQMRYTHAGTALLGQNSDTEIIGFANAASVDSIRITWPTGHIDRLFDVSVNQKLTILEGSTTNGQIEVDDDIEIISHNPPNPPVTFFSEYQDTAGIDHVVRNTDFMGGGAAFFDYDNDGDDDLYLTSGRDRDLFYENQGDGTFSEIGVSAGFSLTESVYTVGVMTGDIDNDGFRDVFIYTRADSTGVLQRNLLFYNNGDGTFSEIWEENAEDIAFTMGANFVDYDLDGLLDIYVVNYVEVGQFLYDDDGNVAGFDHECFENTFYRNLGDLTFQKVTVGLEDTGCALAVTSTDFDGDDDLDIYIANDFGEWIEPNKLYQNNGDDYDEVGTTFNADVPMYGMGIAVGDIDGDLDLDYYVTNFGRNSLLQNGQTTFADIADPAGVADQWVITDSTLTVGWGTAFLDIDNDMDEDLYVANGFVPSPDFIPSQLYMNDKLFLNNGAGNFSDVSLDYGIDNEQVARGMAYSDYDNDGDLDVVSVVLNVPIGAMNWYSRLFKNNKGNEQNWLQVSLEGVDVNRDAFGSKVYLHANGQTFVRELSGGSSHCSQNSSNLHFGLEDVAAVDSLTVVWTGGKRTQTLYDLSVNQRINIQEDTTIQIISDVLTIDLERINYTIFPNPATNQLSIAFNQTVSASKLEIINSIGQKVQERFYEDRNDEFTVDLNGIRSGAYVLRIWLENGQYLDKKFAVVK